MSVTEVKTMLYTKIINFIKGKRGILLIVAMCLFILSTIVFTASSHKVYAASSFEIDYVPIETVEITSESTEVYPGSYISLGVDITPSAAKNTMQNVSYSVVGGTAVAEIKDNTLCISSSAAVGEKIVVEAVVDNVISFNRITFTVVDVPVTQISIDNTETYISQGGELTLNVALLPLNTTQKDISYVITNGSQYASINNKGVVKVKNNLPAGDLKITVAAMSKANSSIYGLKTFNLYVPAKTLSLTADNLTPKLGEQATLIATSDKNASIGEVNYSVISGNEYIEFLQDGILLIKDKIDVQEPTIVLRATRDGIFSDCVIKPYISADFVQIYTENHIIKQGEMLRLGVYVSPFNATLRNISYHIVCGQEYATISENGVLTANICADIEYSSVKIIAKIDGIESEEYEISIERPNITLTADKYTPVSTDTVADEVLLTLRADGLVQTNDVEFFIKDGSEFVESLTNSTLQLKTGISAFNPQVVIFAKYGGFYSGIIILNVKIPVQSIVLSESVIEVEQQKSYNFKGQAYPANATLIGEALQYSLNVADDIATINSDGVLVVSANAPIGQEIVVTVIGADDCKISHSVTVKTVYATELVIDEVLKADGSVVCENNPIVPGDELKFVVDFPEPFNVSETVKIYNCKLISGDDSLVTVNGDTLCIDPDISIDNPSFVIRIISEQNGQLIYQDYTVNVYIFVESVVFTNNVEYVDEGDCLNLDSLLGTTVLPANSTVNQVKYEIVSGFEYALIDGNNLQIDKKLPSGNLSIEVRAISDGVKSISKHLKLYVKTDTLTISVSNNMPKSYLTYGDEIALTTQTDARSTLNAPVLKVIFGAEYLSGNYKNGDTVPQTVTIKSALTKLGKGAMPYIVFGAEQDGVSCLSEQTIIYVPVEKLSLGLPSTADRGATLNIKAIFNDTNNAYVSTTGYVIEKSNQFDVNGSTISLAPNLTAGTKVCVNYYSEENAELKYTSYITINSLSKSFTAVYGNSALFSDAFCVRYGYAVHGNEMVPISEDARQVRKGGYAEIDIAYDGSTDLSLLGINKVDVVFLTSSNYAEKVSLGRKIGILVKDNSYVTGKTVIQFVVKIYDGDKVYISDTQVINVFVEHTEESLHTTTVSAVKTNLKPYFGANASQINVTFVSIEGQTTEFGLTEDGQLTILNLNAKYNPIIKYKYTETYNDLVLNENCEVNIELAIKHATLNNDGGSIKPSYVLSVSGATNLSCEVPTKIGYDFSGYYTGVNGSGSPVSDYSGYAGCILYAKWTPITYYINVYTRYDNADHYVKTLTCIYNESYDLPNPSVGGYSFSKWVDENDGELSNNSTLKVYNMFSANTTASVYATYSKNSSGGGGCVVAGTTIKLSDGSQKAVENINVGDEVLVFDFKSQLFVYSPVILTVNHENAYYSTVALIFEDGTVLELVDSHVLFDVTLMSYVTIDETNVSNYIGDQFLALGDNGLYKNVKLSNAEIGYEKLIPYTLITSYNYNCVTDGIVSATPTIPGIYELTSSYIDDEMNFDYDALKADIELYGVYDYSCFAEYLSMEQYEALCAPYFKLAVEKGFTTFEEVYALMLMYSYLY